MLKSEYDAYLEMRSALVARCEELCRLYARVNFGVESDERELYVTSVETGKSGRIMMEYTSGDVEEMLYFPAEYLWRTDDEVAVLMGREREGKDASLLEWRESHAKEQSA